jgi:NADP-dependent 3-hydroxy acid dehydrogenase YdfG
MTELRDKVVIVTGASSGIGAATAREFGKAGARVVVAARRMERLQALAAEIEGQGRGARALAVAADLSRLEDIQRLVDQALSTFGRIDVLFNNAGSGRLNWLEKLDPAKDIEAQVRINVLGVLQTTRLVLPHMQAQRGGHIINMASVAGLVGTPTYTIYAACKFAVRGFSEALRREAAPWNIRVSVIYPGGVATEFAEHAGIQRKTKVTTPKFMRLTAEQVGQAVVGLVRHPRRELVITWPFRVSVWINMLFPGLVDAATIKQFTEVERKEELEAAGLR